MPELSARRDLELLQGAVDIHIHHGPDLYPRIQDPIELAQDAKAAGMRAVCLKTHNFPTAPMALLARKVVPDIDIFGSIACNLEVGGSIQARSKPCSNTRHGRFGCQLSTRPIMPR